MSDRTQRSSAWASLCGGASETVPLICISPVEEDQSALLRIVSRLETNGGPNWRLHAVSSLTQALALLHTGDIPIVVCDRDLGSSTWKEVFQDLLRLPDPPLLIVSSQDADDRLWAEVLNLGAYDVLTKPFDAAEAIRVLDSAWFHKKHEPQPGDRSLSMALAG